MEEVLGILRTPLQARAHLRWIPQPGLPPMHGDVGQVQQVIINLVMNAAEAMEPHGGAITIRTAQEELTRAGLDRHFPGEALDPGPFVVLEVADNGRAWRPNSRSEFRAFLHHQVRRPGSRAIGGPGDPPEPPGGIQVLTEAGSKGIGNVLEENQAEDQVLVFGRVHIGPQLVSRGPEGFLDVVQHGELAHFIGTRPAL